MGSTHVDPVARATGLLAIAGATVALLDAPLPLRVSLALPLVTVLPGFALARAVFRSALSAAEQLLAALALTLAIDIFIGVGLSVLSVQLHARSWAIALAAITLVFLLLGAHGRPMDSRGTWRVPPRAFGVTIVAAACVCIVAAAIAANREPVSPPKTLRGYTLFWLLPGKTGSYRVGFKSGEFGRSAYRVIVRADGKLIRQWITPWIEPGGAWMRQGRVERPVRIDAYLYRSGAPKPYRHVHIEGTGRS